VRARGVRAVPVEQLEHGHGVEESEGAHLPRRAGVRGYSRGHGRENRRAGVRTLVGGCENACSLAWSPQSVSLLLVDREGGAQQGHAQERGPRATHVVDESEQLEPLQQCGLDLRRQGEARAVRLRQRQRQGRGTAQQGTRAEPRRLPYTRPCGGGDDRERGAGSESTLANLAHRFVRNVLSATEGGGCTAPFSSSATNVCSTKSPSSSARFPPASPRGAGASSSSEPLKSWEGGDGDALDEWL